MPHAEQAGCGTSRPRRTAFACLLAILLLPTWVAAAGDHSPTGTYRGRPLLEVLRELEEAGLDLIYSSAVVRADLRVTAEPTASEPRPILEEILAPLGLRVEDGPGGTLLILSAGAGTGRLEGRVVSALTGRPIPGAAVRIEGAGRLARTDADGRFEMSGLHAGLRLVTVEASGFHAAKTQRVRVSPTGDEELRIELAARPAVVAEVVVTPSRRSLVRQEQASIRTISSEDAVLAPDIGGDTSRVVELLPGVAAPDTSAAFNLRGGIARDTALVLDGLELYDPFHLEAFQSPFSVIDSNAVDRIDVLGGGLTADLGDRHGGFVEISTVVPADAAAGEIEIGTLNGRAAYGAPTKGSLGSWLVSARSWYPEAVRSSIKLVGGEQLDPRFQDAYAKVVLHVTPGSLLSFHGLYAYDRITFQESGEENNESVDARTRNGYAWLRLRTAREGGVSTETVLSGGRIERRRDGVSAPGEGVVTVRDERDVDFFGIRHDLAWELSGSHLLKAGFELRRLEAEYRYVRATAGAPSSPGEPGLSPGGTSTAAYLAYRARLAPDVAAEAGLRWDRQTYAGDSQLSPRLNAVWAAGQRSELRLALGRFSQSQRIHELSVEDGETAFAGPEVAEEAELSFRHSFRRGPHLRVDAYHTRLKRLRPRYENLFEPIELFPETTFDRVQVAPSRARLRGVEMMLRNDPDRSRVWWVSYTLSSADDRIDGRYVPRSWDQTHAAKFLLGFRREDRWFVSLSGTVHTGWPTTPIGAEVRTLPDGATEIVPVPLERNSDRFPTYARLDVKGRLRFDLPRGRLWLTLEIVNLTDRDNPCCVDDADILLQPTTGEVAEVRRRFDHWLGITPSASITWEF